MNSRRIAFFAGMATVVSVPVDAAWVMVGESEQIVFHIDPATIKRTGTSRRAWVIQDLKKRGKHGEMSRRALMDYDCSEHRVRVLSASTHSAPMARGQLLDSTSKAGEWDYIAPESADQALLETACTVPEWVKVAETGDVVHYLDPATIQRSGAIRSAWELQDLKEPVRGAMSFRTHFEFDCKMQRYRGIQFSAHSGPMAFGTVLTASKITRGWQVVSVGSSAHAIFKKVCR